MKILTTILLAISLLTENPICEQANISVLIRDAQTGAVIDEYRSENVVPPASVMKLLTTGAALEMLGPSFRFTTTLEYTGIIENGVLNGDLYIRGGCDPSLGNLKGTQAFIFKWIKAIKAAGIRTIKGSVIADMSLLDGDATNPNWLWEDCGNYYAPGIFALNYIPVNDASKFKFPIEIELSRIPTIIHQLHIVLDIDVLVTADALRINDCLLNPLNEQLIRDTRILNRHYRASNLVTQSLKC